MELPKEFFTVQSMLTLTGATGATFAVSNGLQRAFNFNPKWLALAIAILICMFGVLATGGRPMDYFVGVVNGFLVYCTAAGATTVGASSDSGALTRGTRNSARATSARGGRRFLSPWW
jgi:hypothetical protein